MEFSRSEYWSGLPVPSSGDIPDQGIEPGSPALQANSLRFEPLASQSNQFDHELGSLRFYTYVVQLLSHVWLQQSHGLQDMRLPCPSPSPGACSNSCTLSRWCHPTISSSVVPFSSCLQSFPASESFPMSQRFTSSGQSTGASVSTSVLLVNI